MAPSTKNSDRKREKSIPDRMTDSKNPKHGLKSHKQLRERLLVKKVAHASANSLEAAGKRRKRNKTNERKAQDAGEGVIAESNSNVAPTTVAMETEDMEVAQSQYLVPNVKWFLHVGKKALQVQIHLPKVPHKCIKFAVKEKSLYIDTLKFTRKFKHEFPLYGDVTADPSGVQAEHRHQTLHVRIPVVHIPKETEERELRIVEAKRIAKTIKFPSEIKKSIVEAAERRAKKSEKRRRKKDAEQFYDDPRFDIGVQQQQGKRRKQKKAKDTQGAS